MADPNRAMFESVVRLLVPVLDELVFVGGCTTGIFVTDPAAGGIRPTRDVDAIVDVTSYAQYTALSDRLRTLGHVVRFKSQHAVSGKLLTVRKDVSTSAAFMLEAVGVLRRLKSYKFTLDALKGRQIRHEHDDVCVKGRLVGPLS